MKFHRIKYRNQTYYLIILSDKVLYHSSNNTVCGIDSLEDAFNIIENINNCEFISCSFTKPIISEESYLFDFENLKDFKTKIFNYCPEEFI